MKEGFGSSYVEQFDWNQITPTVAMDNITMELEFGNI
jgi:hypothetical protein